MRVHAAHSHQRVFNVCKLWLQNYAWDFEDENLRRDFADFAVLRLPEAGMESAGDTLAKLLRKRVSSLISLSVCVFVSLCVISLCLSDSLLLCVPVIDAYSQEMYGGEMQWSQLTASGELAFKNPAPKPLITYGNALAQRNHSL